MERASWQDLHHVRLHASGRDASLLRAWAGEIGPEAEPKNVLAPCAQCTCPNFIQVQGFLSYLSFLRLEASAPRLDWSDPSALALAMHTATGVGTERLGFVLPLSGVENVLQRLRSEVQRAMLEMPGLQRVRQPRTKEQKKPKTQKAKKK